MFDDEVIRGERIVLRPAVLDDVPMLAAMAAEPAIARWWGETGEAVWRRRFTDEVDDAHRYVIERDGHPIGFAQWYEEDDPEYRSAGLDLFIAEGEQGQGTGVEVVRLLARWLIEVRGHHRLVIDPAADNVRAIRCYERAGFRPIGVARQRERTQDGTWRDSLLMDLLAEELT
jgi:aminoglycoside 6'-N-acetyltransferase